MSSSLKDQLLNLQSQLQATLQAGDKERSLEIVNQIQQLGGVVHFYPRQQAQDGASGAPAVR